mmetsp:Transcript_55458/g.161973  ORF Transcript_55458/g.161973 Transcript_55458/m.161973 type:complete len:655 (+) Transcript_55458:215-2179(+)
MARNYSRLQHPELCAWEVELDGHEQLLRPARFVASQHWRRTTLGLVVSLLVTGSVGCFLLLQRNWAPVESGELSVISAEAEYDNATSGNETEDDDGSLTDLEKETAHEHQEGADHDQKEENATDHEQQEEHEGGHEQQEENETDHEKQEKDLPHTRESSPSDREQEQQKDDEHHKQLDRDHQEDSDSAKTDHCKNARDMFRAHQKHADACASEDCGWVATQGCSIIEDSPVRRCCCERNYGSLATGPIRWAVHPDRCLSACSRSSQLLTIALGPCTEDLGTLFTMNRSDEYMELQWAYPSNSCLRMQGDSLKASQCEGGNPENQFWFQKTTTDAGLIHWAAYPYRCLSVSSSSDNDTAQTLGVQTCNAALPEQSFSLPTSPKDRFEVMPSLFCVTLIMSKGYELGLVQTQMRRGHAGIFGCNEWAVYSNVSLLISPGPPERWTDIVPGDLTCPFGGKYMSALNTGVFVRFWDAVLKDKRSWQHEWIAKLDADAVFFPERLRSMLRSKWPPAGNPERNLWLNNCYLGNHGPIEVFSRQAFEVYSHRKRECSLLWRNSPQEDVWLRRCLGLLGSTKVDAYNVLYEGAWACTEPPRLGCATYQVAFHPFKSVDTYFECHDNASKLGSDEPLVPFQRTPRKDHSFSEDPDAPAIAYPD